MYLCPKFLNFGVLFFANTKLLIFGNFYFIIEKSLNSFIANLYKNRWQIEVFFKWIKQNLTIKHLWGHSENAVKIHIWIAIIAYLLIAYIKKILDSELSTYDIIQILGLSVFDKSSIKELIANDIDNQYFNEQLNLFDF